MVTYKHQAVDQNGWTFMTHESFSAAPTDVSSQASTVAASKPDVVIAEVTDTNAPLAVKTCATRATAAQW